MIKQFEETTAWLEKETNKTKRKLNGPKRPDGFRTLNEILGRVKALKREITKYEKKN